VQEDDEPVRTQYPEKYSNCNKNMVLGINFQWIYVLNRYKITSED